MKSIHLIQSQQRILECQLQHSKIPFSLAKVTALHTIADIIPSFELHSVTLTVSCQSSKALSKKEYK
jgi:hypothetical protein